MGAPRGSSLGGPSVFFMAPKGSSALGRQAPSSFGLQEPLLGSLEICHAPWDADIAQALLTDVGFVLAKWNSIARIVCQSRILGQGQRRNVVFNFPTPPLRASYALPFSANPGACARLLGCPHRLSFWRLRRAVRCPKRLRRSAAAPPQPVLVVSVFVVVQRSASFW